MTPSAPINPSSDELAAALTQARSVLAAGDLALAAQQVQVVLQRQPSNTAALKLGWQISMAARRWDWALLLGERWRALDEHSLPALQACLVPQLLLHREQDFATTLLAARFAVGQHALLTTLEALYLALLGDDARAAAVALSLDAAQLLLYAKALCGASLAQLLANGWQSALVRVFLLHEQQQACVWPGRSQLPSSLQQLTHAAHLPWQPLRFVSMGYCPSEDPQIALANRMADSWPKQLASAVRAPKAASERLRIAYLSARLGAHATVVLMGCVPREQDHARFEIYAYGFSPLHNAAAPQHTELHVQGCDHVRHLPQDAAQAAAIIAADGIDVLLVMPDWDMDYLAAVCRASGVPVIISYMSFCVSTGGLAHYRIVDDSYVASHSPAREATLRLAGTYYAYSAAASGWPTRQSQGLADGALVLAVFNAAYKISPALADSWAQLLQQDKSAVLWLHQTHPMQAVQLGVWFAARGIAPERLVFAADARHTEHLARCGLADIYLDAWDFNGHTSILDALYAGVPVVTLEGTRIAQRIGANLLRQHGAHAGIASTQAQYQQIALDLMQSSAARRAYREQLERSRAQFAPFNVPLQARRLDAAINAAYARYALGLAPADLVID